MSTSTKYDLITDEGLIGPFTISQIDDLWRQGKIAQDTPVSVAGGRTTRPLRMMFPEIVGGRHVQKMPIRLTTEHLSPWPVAERIDVITAECAFGMNLFRDFFAGVRDVVGGRSKATQNVLRDLRRTVLDELREEARVVGADAVVGVTLNYSEFGSNGSMLFVVATGTAVKLEAPKAQDTAANGTQ